MPSESLFGLFGSEVPPSGVGSPVPKDAAPEDGRREAIAPGQVAGCPCPQRLDVDPDLLEELLELKLDRLLFMED